LLTMLLVRVAGGCVAVALIRAGVPAGGRGVAAAVIPSPPACWAA
jgi:hypothetical protein